MNYLLYKIYVLAFFTYNDVFMIIVHLTHRK